MLVGGTAAVQKPWLLLRYTNDPDLYNMQNVKLYMTPRLYPVHCRLRNTYKINTL